MSSTSEVVMNGKKKTVDWSKFGLGNDNLRDGTLWRGGVAYGTEGHQPTNANELFAGEEVSLNILKV